MPGLNRKGPQGKGPQTGRGLGKCNPGEFETDGQNKEGNRWFSGQKLRFGQRIGKTTRGRGMGRNK